MCILGGDLLLARASTGLASLRLPRLMEIVSVGIAEFTESQASIIMSITSKMLCKLLRYLHISL